MNMASRILILWQSHFYRVRTHWMELLVWTGLEPTLYLLCFGLGIGGLIGEVHQKNYIHFLFPGLVVISVAASSFFEASSGVYSRVIKKKTLLIMAQAPLTLTELAVSEFLWAATVGLFTGIYLFILGAALSLVDLPTFSRLACSVLLTSFLGSAVGLFICSRIRQEETFSLMNAGVLLPVTLLSGCYFPIDEMPHWLEWISYLSPLTHLVLLAQSGGIPWAKPEAWVHLFYALVFAVLVARLAIKQLDKRIELATS